MRVEYFFLGVIISLSLSACKGSSSSPTPIQTSTPAPTLAPIKADDLISDLPKCSITVGETPYIQYPEAADSSYELIGRRDPSGTISSNITGVTYPYHIYLPPEYDLEPERRFDILYFTDAMWIFQYFSRIVDIEHRPLILVGIEEGPKNSGRRGIDYSSTSTDYFDFFTQEFMPLIEGQYRVSPDNRTFQGTSLGGTVSLLIMLLDDPITPLFKNHMSFDPAGTQNRHIFDAMLDERKHSGVPLNKKLLISSATGGFAGNVVPFVKRAREKNIEGFDIFDYNYNVSHGSAGPVSFSNALRDTYDCQK